MAAKYTLALLLFVPWHAFPQNPWKDIYSEKNWADRDKWQKADEIIHLLELEPGNHVADIGSHEGYFTMKLSRKVPAGKVYAVDIAAKKIERLKQILEEREINNVMAILGKPDNPELPARTMDAALIVDTYHEIKEHKIFLENLKRTLKANARLVICEPIASERKGLSRQQQFKKHELESSFVVRDLKEAGFRIIFMQENFIDRTKEKGDIMWIIVAQKQ